MKVSTQFGLFLAAISMLLLSTGASAQEGSLSLQLQKQTKLKTTTGQHKLNYPESTKRFYHANGNKLTWIKPEDKAAHTFQAMLLLDCVLQYGLSHADYHPDILTYDQLQFLIGQPEKVTHEQKAAFDIMLTDAMISLINHLHYGKLNPLISSKKIDQSKTLEMRADLELAKLIKSNDVATGIAALQPKSTAYQNLQAYLKLVRGQYTGDCYAMPEAKARLAAINMERLRWAYSAKALKKNLPEKYRHLTCEIKDGLPVIYKDRYQQDKALEKALFGIDLAEELNNDK